MKQFITLFFLCFVSNANCQSFLIENQSNRKVYFRFQEHADSIESHQQKEVYDKTMRDYKLGWVMVYMPTDSTMQNMKQKQIFLFSEEKTDRKLSITQTNEVLFASNTLEMNYNIHYQLLNKDNIFQTLETIFKDDKEGLESVAFLNFKLCISENSVDTIQYFFNKVPLKAQQSYWGQEVFQYIKSRKTLVVGNTLNDFELLDTTNQKRALTDIKSEYILLDFWFSTCKPCLASFPSLLELYDRTDKKKLEIVAISIDKESQKGLWRSRIRQHNLKWINLLDPQSEIAYKTLAINEYPTKILIDKNRKIISINPTIEAIEKILYP